MPGEDPYADVWPSTRVGAEETENFRQRQEIILDVGLRISEITNLADECGVPWDQLRFDCVGAIGGLALRVWVDEDG